MGAYSCYHDRHIGTHIRTIVTGVWPFMRRGPTDQTTRRIGA